MDESHPDVAAAWRQFTAEANTLFDAGAIEPAMAGYERARWLALARFGQWPDAQDAVTAVMVSYLNLSEAQARLGLLTRAAQSLCTVHGSLAKTARDPGLAPAVRDAARRCLVESHAALWRFQAVYGEHPDVARWLALDLCACCGAERTPASSSTTVH